MNIHTLQGEHISNLYISQEQGAIHKSQTHKHKRWGVVECRRWFKVEICGNKMCVNPSPVSPSPLLSTLTHIHPLIYLPPLPPTQRHTLLRYLYSSFHSCNQHCHFHSLLFGDGMGLCKSKISTRPFKTKHADVFLNY